MYDLSFNKKYKVETFPGFAVATPAGAAAWRFIEQNHAIWLVATNRAKEDTMAMFENGIANDTAFQQLVFQWQRALEKPYCCICCRSGSVIAARRLRVALRTVVKHKRKLPPEGGVLIDGDTLPAEVHTPRNLMDVDEQMHILQDRAFRHAKPAIELAKNIILAADEAHKVEQAVAAGTRRGTLTLAEMDTISVYHSSGSVASLGGDIGPGGPERTPSQVLSGPSASAFLGFLSASVAAIIPSRASQHGASRSGTIARDSAEAGQPPSSSPAVARSSGSSERRPSPSATPAGPSHGFRPGHSAAAGPLAGLRGREGYQSLQPFEIEGPVPPSTTPSPRRRGLPSAIGGLQNLLGRRRAGISESGPTAPTSPSGPAQAALEMASSVGSLVSIGRPEAEAPTPSTPPRPSTPRAKEQNFGSTLREKRRLLAAAHKNLEKNEVDLPIPRERAMPVLENLQRQSALRQAQRTGRSSVASVTETASQQGTQPPPAAADARRPRSRASPTQAPERADPGAAGPSASGGAPSRTEGFVRAAARAAPSTPAAATPGRGSGRAAPPARGAGPAQAPSSPGSRSTSEYQSARSRGSRSGSGSSVGAPGVPSWVAGRRQEIEEAERSSP